MDRKRARRLAAEAVEERYVVVGLEDNGDEIKRVTVLPSRLAEAKELFQSFSDWIEVFKVDQSGRFLSKEKGWSRYGDEKEDA
jgi:hypothetical protein